MIVWFISKNFRFHILNLRFNTQEGPDHENDTPFWSEGTLFYKAPVKKNILYIQKGALYNGLKHKFHFWEPLL